MRLLILSLLAASSVHPLYAETSADSIPTISFAPFPRQLERIYLYNYKGTSATKAKMDSPAPDDFPPFAMIGFEDGHEALKPGRYYFPSRNYLRVYNIIAVKTAPYQTIQADIAKLEDLLSKRPTKVPSGGEFGKVQDKYERFPDYPPRNAGHVLQIKTDYVDASWGSGLFYVTQFAQDTAWPNNDELVYIFQGLSKDRHYFVSADFHVTHPKAFAGIDDMPKAIKDGSGEERDEFVEKVTSTLAKEPDDSFTPSLAAIRRWVTTLKFAE
jgi:hypothetical protein